MLGYRHAFHAGNFADVHKHAVLVALLYALMRKPKPCCVLDTHAGAGRYDLTSERALLNREFDNGIGRLWPLPDSALDPTLAAYLALVRAANPDGRLRWYPGSPALSAAVLRADDALLACELHPSDHPDLRGAFAGDRRVAVHHRDGYEALRALLPPAQRRGLVLMDPSFEVDGEFRRLGDALVTIGQRWPGAVVAIWYPILAREPSAAFLAAVRGMDRPATLCCELGLWPWRAGTGLNGSGMLLLNTPWGLDGALGRLHADLAHHLGAVTWRVEWLVPPQ